jgi:diguanylate cyclase (GGDEF)-like protein
MANGFKEMIIRHRLTLTDIAMIGAVVVAALFGVWQFDIFPNETSQQRYRVFELDEIFAICALTFALFAWSRLRAQRREIHRRRAAEEEARILAFEDTLTGLPNRRQFHAALNAALEAPPSADAVHAVFMLDLNGFKKINDLEGHPAGDEALIQTALRLRRAVREGDMVARFGGDEFAILARHLSGAEAAASLALRVIEEMGPPVRAGNGDHPIGTGIGIALAPPDGTDAETLLRKADVALYRAKSESGSALRFFEEEMDHHIRERDKLERDLRGALDAGAIEIRYQPRIDLRTGAAKSFEAQPYWHHGELGNMDAARLFPIAETAGLLRPLFEELLRKACGDTATWSEEVTLSFAIPASLLRDAGIGLRILAVLGATRLPPRRLELELSESALVADLQTAKRVLGDLHDAGVRVALNNFGTGYSSLYHLRNFKLDTIKIDRSFVQAMTANSESASIVRALIGLGSGLGLTVAAEGVQDEQQRQLLSREGCHEGHLFAQDFSAQEVCDLLISKVATSRTVRSSSAN